MDVLLSRRLNRFIDDAVPQAAGTCILARPGLQTLDLAHGVAMVLEKGLDRQSRGAAAQADIEKYYDNLDLIVNATRNRLGLSMGPWCSRSGTAAWTGGPFGHGVMVLQVWHAWVLWLQFTRIGFRIAMPQRRGFVTEVGRTVIDHIESFGAL